MSLTVQSAGQKTKPPALLRRLRLSLEWSPVFLIALVAWIANFVHFRGFGYYEDDWYYYPPAFGRPVAFSFVVLLPRVKMLFVGRPVTFLVQAVLACSDILSTTLPYVVIYCLFAASAILFYLVLRKRFPAYYCLIAALFFVLSPLTTVRQNLNIQGFLGAGLIWVFSAVLIRRKHPVAAYLLAWAGLFTYESLFMLFLAAPLFERGRLHARKARELVIHWGLCGVIVGVSLWMRRLVGEDRVAHAANALNQGPLQKVFSVWACASYYSIRSFFLYVYACWVSLKEHPIEPLLYLAPLVALAVWMIGKQQRRSRTETRRMMNARRLWWFWNGAMFGAFLLAVGYVTSYFQISQWWIIFFTGRDTRFSASGVPGSSMFVATLVVVAELWLSRSLRWIPRVAAGLLLSVLFIYSFVIQSDYVRSWDYQKHFLSQAVLLTPDLQADGAIIVQTVPTPLPGYSPGYRPASIGAQRFGITVGLLAMRGQLVFPLLRRDLAPEILFVPPEQWKTHLKIGDDGNLHWTQPEPGSIAETVVPGRVIVLNEDSDGVITRSNNPVSIDGKVITSTSATMPASGNEWREVARSGLLETIVNDTARQALRSYGAAR